MSVLYRRPKADKSKTLVESRHDYYSDQALLSIYDTYDCADKVALASHDNILYCGMITGKKVMHVPNAPNRPIEFLPSESFILQPDSEVLIDFPVATHDTPTTCLAIEISQKKILDLNERMCDCSTLYAEHAQTMGGIFFHSRHNQRVQAVLENLVDLFSESEQDRAMLIELGITELVIRMMRTESYRFLLTQTQEDGTKSPLHLAIQRMKQRLSFPFDIDDLCKHAYVSRSKLYDIFRRELGRAPHAVLMQLRLERAEALLHGKLPIATICFDLGFVSEAHFSRCFKAMYGRSPTAYRKYIQQEHQQSLVHDDDNATATTESASGHNTLALPEAST